MTGLKHGVREWLGSCLCNFPEVMKSPRAERDVVILLLLFAVFASPRAQGVLIAYEPFDYPTSSNLSSNAGGNGWIGPWIYSPLISSHGTINSTNLTYG